MADPVPSRSLVIIGGGLSGTLVAVHALRHAPVGTRVVLIERHPPVGRGVAYGTDSPDHLLNVPAGRMSAWPDDPEHFLRWVRERVGQTGYPSVAEPGDFLPRRLYGEYLGFLFMEAQHRLAPGVSFESVAGEVIDIDERAAGGGRVVLQEGGVIEADRVVLAMGHLPGEYPIRRSLPIYKTRRYVHVPWIPGVLEGIGRDEAVLIVGQGLTAVDMVVELTRLGHTGKIHAISRRGLRPQVHAPGEPYASFIEQGGLPTTVREAVRRIRSEVKKVAASGLGWRPVIDSLRPHTQAIWQGFSAEERGRFMRHVRPYWEVYRHRLAPRIAAVIQEQAAQGRLFFHAGRLEAMVDTPAGAQVTFRKRGCEDRVTLTVSRVINCTGPRTDYSKYQHPLLINLLARGLIDHDPLALGVAALPSGEVLRYRGGPTGWLFALGAPLKGVLWECTAVPEIRSQAQRLVQQIMADWAT
ncbi:FAD/NAD(P)-binding protein [Opitutaceae bacterium]